MTKKKYTKFTEVLKIHFCVLKFGFLGIGVACCVRVGVPKLFSWDPQNNSARDWRPQSTLEVAYNVVHSHANALLGLQRYQYNTKEQQLNSHSIIFKYLKKDCNQNTYNNGLNMQF